MSDTAARAKYDAEVMARVMTSNADTLASVVQEMVELADKASVAEPTDVYQLAARFFGKADQLRLHMSGPGSIATQMYGLCYALGQDANAKEA